MWRDVNYCLYQRLLRTVIFDAWHAYSRNLYAPERKNICRWKWTILRLFDSKRGFPVWTLSRLDGRLEACHRPQTDYYSRPLRFYCGLTRQSNIQHRYVNRRDFVSMLLIGSLFFSSGQLNGISLDTGILQAPLKSIHRDIITIFARRGRACWKFYVLLLN